MLVISAIAVSPFIYGMMLIIAESGAGVSAQIGPMRSDVIMCGKLICERLFAMVTTINVPLPESLAHIYETASPEDKLKAQWLIEMVLDDLFRNQTESLSDVVRDISERATERGLTPEILDELLKEDE
jgi:hypothetical protein